MASDIKTTGEDADMAECDGEKVVTMMDVLQEQEEFEEDANAVLGASDDKNCTYSKGYIKRQAIYACLTCCPEAKSDPTKRAGVCLACSLMCHENHELIELYTKRNFRCDCGNPKFNSHPCTFTSVKTDLNEDNYYNQNFSGLYCTCQRPYPDPESAVEDEMIQCIICEDWLHASHLQSAVPANYQYSEMICKNCMERNDFLYDYSDLAVNTESNEVDVVSVNGVEYSKSGITNSDDKTATGTILSLNNVDKKLDEEMPEEKLDKSVTDTATIKLENSEGIESSTNQPTNKEDNNTSNTIEKAIDTNQLDVASTTDDVSKDNTDDTSKVCVKLESGCGEENVSDETKDKDVLKEQQDGKTTINAQDVSNTIEDAENIKETKKQDAEKMEEDRLLADPDDNKQNLVAVDNNKVTTDKDSTMNETENNTVQTNNRKSEIDSIIADNSKTFDEKTNKNEISNDDIEQKDQGPTQSENNKAHTDSSSENKPPLDNLPKEDKDSKELTIQDNTNEEVKSSSSEKRKFTEGSSDNITKKPKLNGEICTRPKGIKKMCKGATFWPSNFRQKLCMCQECISMYKDLSILFLTDPEDTVSAYENLGKQKINGEPATQYEKGLQALSSLDRVQQINALTEYNRMRDKLLEYLKSFKDKKEIVKEEDIKAFFAGMKPKRETDGVYFCR